MKTPFVEARNSFRHKFKLFSSNSKCQLGKIFSRSRICRVVRESAKLLIPDKCYSFECTSHLKSRLLCLRERIGKRTYPCTAFERHQTHIKEGDLNAHIGKLTEKMRNKNAFISYFTSCGTEDKLAQCADILF